MTEKLKILVVAPNASSRFGGEAFLPLKYFELLRRRGHPARLIAHERNRTNLEELLAPWLVDVHFIEDTIWHRTIWQMGRLFPRPLREPVFGTALNFVNEFFQARLIRRLVRMGAVDLLHQPIPVSPKAPSWLYGFDVPVVIGPMNGGMAYPPGYEDLQSAAERRFVAVARKIAILVNRLVPGKRRAAALLVANPRTAAALPVHNHPRVIELVENGVDLSVWHHPATPISSRTAGEVLRLVFMGRLVGWKAVEITLEALHRARQAGVPVGLEILGDGERRSALEAETRRLGLEGAVRFHGFRSQAECAAMLQDSDALILNSVNECGGAVVLEAMSLGLPVIASDWGGPADYLDDHCGILVAPVPRNDFAERLADAILTLARDPDLRHRMGQAGRHKVEMEFDWERKMDRMLEIYREVLAAPVPRAD